MKENKYDNEEFFLKYSQMDRSKRGLKGAGEWSELQKVLPDFASKRVLDLGCGYGWHCIYAAEHGAESVTGIDISEKMLETAGEKNSHEKIRYRRCAMEDLDFPKESFDVVIDAFGAWTEDTLPQHSTSLKHLCEDRKSTRLNSSHRSLSRMPSSA